MNVIKLVDENLLGQPGLCPHIDPKVGWKRDVDEYDIAIYTDRLCLNQQINETKVNYAWLIEPPIINGENYRDIVGVSNKFKCVFSHNKNLATKINNFYYIPHGGTWLKEDEIEIKPKKKLLSFIFSDKQWNPYHRLRHRIYDMLKDNNNIDFFGSGCNRKIQFKSEALNNYYFSIVIENSEEDVYFTEKLLDCLLTGTVPVYVGSSHIGEYFNEQSILRFKDPEQLPDIINKLTPEFYASLNKSIQENFEKAKQYIHPELLIQKCLATS